MCKVDCTVVVVGNDSNGDGAAALTTLAPVGVATIADVTRFGLAVVDLTRDRHTVVRGPRVAFTGICLARSTHAVDIVRTDVGRRRYRASAGAIRSRLRARQRGSSAVATVAVAAATAACGSLGSADTLTAYTLTGNHRTEDSGRFVGMSTLATIAAKGIATSSAMATRAEITSLDRGNRTAGGSIGIQNHPGHDRVASRSTGGTICDAAKSADPAVGVAFVNITSEGIAALTETALAGTAVGVTAIAVSAGADTANIAVVNCV